MKDNICRPRELQRIVSREVGFNVNIENIYSLKSRLKKKLTSKNEELLGNDFQNMCENHKLAEIRIHL
jgi:hypothetical protein